MNRNTNLCSILLLILLTLAGCHKSDLDTAAPGALKKDWFKNLKKAKLTAFSIEEKNHAAYVSLTSALGQRKLNDINGINGVPGTIGGTYRTDYGVHPISGNPNQAMYQESFKSNVFVIAPEMGLNIYPGAILDGHSIHAAVFAPTALQNVSAHIRPVNISTSLPVSSSVVARTLMARPSASNAFLRAALTDLEAVNPGNTGAARLQFEIASFSNYAMVKALYGYNKNINLFLYKNNGSVNEGTQNTTQNTGFILKFFQQNFTVDVDVPSDYSELFDPSGLDTAAVFGGVSPYYVSSVTYGRMGIMTIESSSDSATVYNAITKQIGILQGLVGAGTTMTDAETRIINEAEIRYAITGPGGDTNTLRAISSAADFIQVLGSQATYSMDSPGVPISFRLRYLVDDTNVEAPFEINYGPFDKPYSRVEYRNKTSQTTQTADGGQYDREFADINIYCYPTSACVPGTELPPLNYISFALRKTTVTSDGRGSESRSDVNSIMRNPMKNSSIYVSSGMFLGNTIGPDFYRYLMHDEYTLLSGQGYFELPTKF